MTDSFIIPDWPAPANVRAAVTTRSGGVSVGPYAAFNLAAHVNDDPAHVAENRRRLRERLDLPAEPAWLEQVHGDAAVDAGRSESRRADASFTDEAGTVCAVLTADCLPVLFCDVAGTRVAAAHAGWKGLAAGVLRRTAQALSAPVASREPAGFPANTREIIAWLGPAIGPGAFEVGGEVREAFLARLSGADAAFSPKGQGKWLADLYALARLDLAAAGVTRVYGGGLCTYSDGERFYSYRREPVTGRMASLIWLASPR